MLKFSVKNHVAWAVQVIGYYTRKRLIMCGDNIIKGRFILSEFITGCKRIISNFPDFGDKLVLLPSIFKLNNSGTSSKGGGIFYC